MQTLAGGDDQPMRIVLLHLLGLLCSFCLYAAENMKFGVVAKEKVKKEGWVGGGRSLKREEKQDGGAWPRRKFILHTAQVGHSLPITGYVYLLAIILLARAT